MVAGGLVENTKSSLWQWFGFFFFFSRLAETGSGLIWYQFDVLLFIDTWVLMLPESNQKWFLKILYDQNIRTKKSHFPNVDPTETLRLCLEIYKWMEWKYHKRMERNGMYLSKGKEWKIMELSNLDWMF